MYRSPFRILQMDLVSTCNAKCPYCFRQTLQGQPNPHFPKNVHLDLEVLRKLLGHPRFHELEEVVLCGNYGDALASPRILEVVDLIRGQLPRAAINIHSNGGLGSKRTWHELGRRLQNHGNLIKFAIDGLEDTNFLYRRGVSWQKVMENSETFIKAGGRAIWKFVVFNHNRHQIDKARELAQQRGFGRFEARPNYTPESEPLPSEELAHAPVKEDAPQDFAVPARLLQSLDIDCDSQKNDLIFLDFSGRLWPCCWISGWKYASTSSMRDYHHRYFDEKWGDDFNDLNFKTVDEVLNHPVFTTEIESSWQHQEDNAVTKAHHECAHKCGKRRC